MYESFYGLKEKPFNLTPDPAYLFMSSGHSNTYAHLEYAIMENKGFVVITGEIGSGKTTLINYLLGHMQKDIVVGLVNDTDLHPEDFLKIICQEFELEVKGMSRADMMGAFRQNLLSRFAENKRVILIIDEAQNLSSKTIEAIRMLSNLESEKKHLLQMILVGQPNLTNKLQQKELRQFVQRVTVHCHLSALNEEEVDKYIHHRLRVAGAKNPGLFSREAIAAVSVYSEGIPRLINVVCDTALVYGFGDGFKTIDGKTIAQVVQSRKNGGIFSEPPSAARKAPSPGFTAKKVLANFEKRIQSLEKAIDLSAKMTVKLETRLNDWTRYVSKRDDIIARLLEILQENQSVRTKMISENVPMKEWRGAAVATKTLRHKGNRFLAALSLRSLDPHRHLTGRLARSKPGIPLTRE
jgi:general secretion pathway protein A